CEYGGMNDVLTYIYELTGNKKYLDLSYKFHDHFLLDELAKRVDALTGKHSNTNVPKAIGCARRHDLTGKESDKTIASFLWESMARHHSYVIGGNSNHEYLTDPDKLTDHLSDNTCETCNTYNMLKLTRYLFSWQPNQELADYYERALYNHILASQNPETGMMCYFIPLRMGSKKEFSDPFDTFTCCVGSGMENHSKYTEGIYYEGKDGSLIVNLFIPSELQWKEKGVKIRQESAFPETDKINFIIEADSRTPFSLKIRQPKWAAGDVMIKVNEQIVKPVRDNAGYWTISRTWGKVDRVEISTPMKVYTESMPDNKNRIALLYGPVVMAGQLGTEMPDPVYGTTVLMTEDHNVNDWTKKISDQPLVLQTNQVARPVDVNLIPFYKTYNQYYNVYWDFFTPAEWSRRQAEYEEEKKRQHEIEVKTIDMIRIGEMQPERDHKLKATDKSYVSNAMGRAGREVRGGGYFSFEMKVDQTKANSLLCSYIGDDKNRTFDLLVDDVKIATEDWKGGTPGRFYDMTYPIPPELIKGKTSVVIRVQGRPDRTAGRIFGCRIIKND
ncbi:MAG TPA: glycoside hydrolase family 127 protein, partial [Cyclobacteriaceae bacterium]|nr:glycoside hydrolase family 127 protein [Cyclobacteriaceae bacterium]